MSGPVDLSQLFVLAPRQPGAVRPVTAPPRGNEWTGRPKPTVRPRPAQRGEDRGEGTRRAAAPSPSPGAAAPTSPRSAGRGDGPERPLPAPRGEVTDRNDLYPLRGAR